MNESMFAPTKVRERKKLIGIIGRSVCISTQTKTGRMMAAARKDDQNPGVGPAALAGLNQAPGEGGDAGRDQDGARNVGGDRARLITRFPHDRLRHQQGSNADGHVDQEDPAPTEVLDDGAADNWTKGNAGNGNGAPDADGAATLFGREGIRDQRQRERHDQRGAHTLQRAHHDQHVHAVGKGRDGRNDGEEREADHEPAFAAELVAEATGGDLQRCEDEGVRRDHPLQLGGAGVQIARDRWQGDIDDEVVQHRHEERETGGNQRVPLGVVVINSIR